MSSYPEKRARSFSKEGFLLVELLVGLTLLSIVILGVGNYIHLLASDQAEGKNRLQAVSLARYAMERLCAGRSHEIELKKEQFSIDWKLLPLLNSSFSHAEVCVSWQDKNKAVRSVTLQSGVMRENI